MALLEPTDHLRDLELAEDYTSRLALLEGLKGMPFGVVWDYYCAKQGAPVGASFIADIKDYEKAILVQRQ